LISCRSLWEIPEPCTCLFCASTFVAKVISIIANNKSCLIIKKYLEVLLNINRKLRRSLKTHLFFSHGVVPDPADGVGEEKERSSFKGEGKRNYKFLEMPLI
jgi:hypothetical protein